MDPKAVILGVMVGFLVGLTGMGGGAVMTPVLILLGGVQPIVAVGTDLIWGTVTKAVGAAVHYRQGNVNFGIVGRLALGSVPGALLGVAVLAHLNARHGSAPVNAVVVRTLGVALIAVGCSLFFRVVRGAGSDARTEENSLIPNPWITTAVGAVVGFLVSITSVGSGSLIVASLLILYPTLRLSRIVGSDILHGVILVAVAGFSHLRMGHVNYALLLSLLAGSIPGVWLGSRMSSMFPEKALRPVLGTTLLVLGWKLL
jgi:uncharacterized membrane protein YfcA